MSQVPRGSRKGGLALSGDHPAPFGCSLTHRLGGSCHPKRRGTPNGVPTWQTSRVPTIPLTHPEAAYLRVGRTVGVCVVVDSLERDALPAGSVCPVRQVPDAGLGLLRICILDLLVRRKDLAQTPQGTVVLINSVLLRLTITQPSHHASFGTTRITMSTTRIAIFGLSTVTKRIGDEGTRREVEI